MKLTTTKRRRRAFIEGYEFPMALQNKLREELEGDRPVGVALEGLREWYLACLEAGPKATLGMPSRAVDVAWHEMILMTRTYHHFCERAFGYYLHHSPEETMDEAMPAGLRRTLATLEREPMVPGYLGIPFLFALDGELGIQDGQTWTPEDLDSLRSSGAEEGSGFFGGDGGDAGSGGDGGDAGGGGWFGGSGGGFSGGDAGGGGGCGGGGG
jgi:hypothetical protein